MLVSLLLFAHLALHRTMPALVVIPPRPVSAHSEHVTHERHLAHLHWLHVRHLRDVAPKRTRATAVSHPRPALVSAHLSGTLSCPGLEALWVSAGGSRSAAFLAAEIAMAESGGNQYATGPAGERGYWQIHPDHGALSTYDPFGNARAAVIISDDGRNWSAWTTYTSGAYHGRCLGR